MIKLLIYIIVFISFCEGQAQEDTIRLIPPLDDLMKFNMVPEETYLKDYYEDDEKIIQVNLGSPFLPNHGDILIYGYIITNEKVLSILNDYCFLDSYLFYDEKLNKEQIVFYNENSIDENLLSQLVFSILIHEIPKYE